MINFKAKIWETGSSHVITVPKHEINMRRVKTGIEYYIVMIDPKEQETKKEDENHEENRGEDK